MAQCSSLHLRYCYLRWLQRVSPGGGLYRRSWIRRCSLHTSAMSRRRSVDDEGKVVSGVNKCPFDCFCSNNINPDYKNVRLLSQFVSSQTGMILPRTITKICRKKQKEVAKAIKRARTMGFMPYTNKLPEYLNDPKLF